MGSCFSGERRFDFLSRILLGKGVGVTGFDDEKRAEMYIANAATDEE
jgi:hypothetical protein